MTNNDLRIMDPKASSSKTQSSKSQTSSQRSRSEWVVILDEFVNSSQAIAHFCAQKNIAKSSFYAWRKRLKDQNSSQEETQPPPQKQKPKPSFLPFVITDPQGDAPKNEPPKSTAPHQKPSPKPGPSSGLTLHISSRFSLTIHQDFCAPTLKLLVQTMGEISC